MQLEPEADLLPHRRGINDRQLRREDFIELFTDFLDSRLYGEWPTPPRRRQERAPEQEYISNRAFWTDVIGNRLYDGSRICLRDFTLLEWTPSSPGRFYTQKATEKRREAKEFLRYFGDDAEYLPLGKADTVLGGVGSLRLGSRLYENGFIHVLGMSSTGVAHEGIPVALNDRGYASVVHELQNTGGLTVDAMGTLRTMPQREWRIGQTEDVPAVFVIIDDLIVRRLADSTLATASIMFPSGYHDWSDSGQGFSSNGYTTKFLKSWSYASFSPTDGPDALKRSVRWLQDYAIRYSGMDMPPIFSDFDEQHSHFEIPVEFSLLEAATGALDIKRLLAYSDFYKVQINIGELRMGDTFSNITGATIINRSTVMNSLNSAPGQDDESRKLILKIVDLINKSGNKEAAEQFQGFIEEVAKPTPRKSILSALWASTIAILPAIRDIAGVAEKILPMLG